MNGYYSTRKVSGANTDHGSAASSARPSICCTRRSTRRSRPSHKMLVPGLGMALVLYFALCAANASRKSHRMISHRTLVRISCTAPLSRGPHFNISHSTQIAETRAHAHTGAGITHSFCLFRGRGRRRGPREGRIEERLG